MVPFIKRHHENFSVAFQAVFVQANITYFIIERGNAVLGFGYILCFVPTLNFSNALRILKRILPECFCTSLKNIYHGND